MIKTHAAIRISAARVATTMSLAMLLLISNCSSTPDVRLEFEKFFPVQIQRGEFLKQRGILRSEVITHHGNVALFKFLSRHTLLLTDSASLRSPSSVAPAATSLRVVAASVAVGVEQGVA